VNFVYSIFKAIRTATNVTLCAFLFYMIIGWLITLLIKFVGGSYQHCNYVAGFVICCTIITWFCSFSYFLGRIK
jgi:hypothetical protein